MAYGVKYKLLFNNRDNDRVTVNILEKDYTDTATYELQAADNPLILDYQMDEEDIFQPIRTSSAKMRYWNNGGFPVTTFMSDDEDKFKVEVWISSLFGTYLYWTGFLVQDDCKEAFKYPPNIVQLEATDNIGLLKGLPITDALDNGERRNTFYTFTGSITVGDAIPLSNLMSWIDADVPALKENDRIVVSGGTSFDGTYTVAGAIQVGTANTARLNEEPGNATATGTITISRIISVRDKLLFSQIIEACLAKTGLETYLNICCNVYEENMTDRAANPNADPLNQSKVNCKSYIQGKQKYDTCYEVLVKILSGWKCTLFQAKGEWFIVRWPEAKRFNNEIPGTRYEYGLLNPEPIILDIVKTIGKGYPIHPIYADQIKSIVRSNKYTRLQFDYEQPYKLILNDDLLELGEFIATNTVSGIRYDDYGLVDITAFNSQSAFIRVATDLTTGDELERYVVMEQNASGTAGIYFNDVEVNEGDRFNFAFSHRGEIDQSVGEFVAVDFRLFIPNGDHYILKWQSGATYQDNYFYWEGPLSSVDLTDTFMSKGRIPDDDLSKWGQYEFTYHTPKELSAPFPADGLLRCYINGYNPIGSPPNSFTMDLYLKDFAIELKTFVNDSTLIIGQVHKAEQTGVKKQNYEETIFLDDAPKNSIKGVMFLDDGVTKTTLWHRNGVSETVRFGHIQKTDLLHMTDAYRVRIEGSFRGLKDNLSYVDSLLAIFNSNVLSDKSFILGPVSFNLHTCEFSGYLEELWSTSETHDETLYTNTFNYIYDRQ